MTLLSTWNTLYSSPLLPIPLSLSLALPSGLLSLGDKMADTGKLLEAPGARSRVAPISTPASKPKRVHYPFWFGGSASCFAAGVTHPLDLGECSC